MFIDEREREPSMWKENINCLPPAHTPAGGPTDILGMCPDQESQRPFGYRIMFQPTEPYSPVLFSWFSLYSLCIFCSFFVMGTYVYHSIAIAVFVKIISIYIQIYSKRTTFLLSPSCFMFLMLYFISFCYVFPNYLLYFELNLALLYFDLQSNFLNFSFGGI